ncbi:hypothetical protein DID80_00270 [Candidatus Marinamargulisbacteria bacterium SCGC AAA071-K20]|nr:hypothetical protein DID80_00270 [Candidatus Marinamargulisbacteria bacterium SCGC AAA071-K20]
MSSAVAKTTVLLQTTNADPVKVEKMKSSLTQGTGTKAEVPRTVDNKTSKRLESLKRTMLEVQGFRNDHKTMKDLSEA